jgi:hypothetical protein
MSCVVSLIMNEACTPGLSFFFSLFRKQCMRYWWKYSILQSVTLTFLQESKCCLSVCVCCLAIIVIRRLYYCIA